jgi:hypothetical protein
MEKTLCFIGVRHSWQWQPPPTEMFRSEVADFETGQMRPIEDAEWEHFRQMLRDTIDKNNLQGIAEEAHSDYFKHHWWEHHSLGYNLVKEKKLKAHCYCEMDRKTRAEKKIDALPKIEQFRVREEYWLERLSTFDAFPALFLLGADHVDTFFERLTQAGYPAPVILERDWELSPRRWKKLSP